MPITYFVCSEFESSALPSGIKCRSVAILTIILCFVSRISWRTTMNSSCTKHTNGLYCSRKSGKASNINSVTSSSHSFLNSDGKVNALDVLLWVTPCYAFSSPSCFTWAESLRAAVCALNKSRSSASNRFLCSTSSSFIWSGVILVMSSHP